MLKYATFSASLAITSSGRATTLHRGHLPKLGLGGFLGLAAFAAYLVAGTAVILGTHSIIGDAWSRVANAYYVLFSRDPHLAAVGFVWNPLPSLAVLPLLPLKFVWPDIVATGFAGSIVSALCMGASVAILYGIALDWGVRRSLAVVVTLFYALDPMIVYYGANGMSEAMFILTMLLVVRYLGRWSKDRSVGSLALAGVALAAAYLTRYEAAAAALASFIGVVLVSSIRSSGHWRDRAAEGVADAIVFIAPFLAAFGGWALASWMIVGDPFEQFTSVYGVVSQLNVAQGQVAATTGQGTSAAYMWSLHQLLGLEPGLLVVAALGLIATLRGRYGITIPAVAVLGSVVTWAVFGFLTGRTLGWLRYSIAEIPLVSVLAIAVLSPDTTLAGVSRAALRPVPVLGRVAGLAFRVRPRSARPALSAASASPADDRLARTRRLGGVAAGALVVATVAAAVPIGLVTMLDPSVNPSYGGEAWQLQPVLTGHMPAEPVTPDGQYLVGRQAATYLDALHLGSGKVLVDGAMGFPIILESSNPTQFIVTADRDFQEALLDPVSFGVEYLLVPEAVGYQSLDAINRAYPGIYDHGTSVAPTLVAQFGAGGNNWRIYRVSS